MKHLLFIDKVCECCRLMDPSRLQGLDTKKLENAEISKPDDLTSCDSTMDKQHTCNLRPLLNTAEGQDTNLSSIPDSVSKQNFRHGGHSNEGSRSSSAEDVKAMEDDTESTKKLKHAEKMFISSKLGKLHN